MFPNHFSSLENLQWSYRSQVRFNLWFSPTSQKTKGKSRTWSSPQCIIILEYTFGLDWLLKINSTATRLSLFESSLGYQPPVSSPGRGNRSALCTISSASLPTFLEAGKGCTTSECTGKPSSSKSQNDSTVHNKSKDLAFYQQHSSPVHLKKTGIKWVINPSGGV